MSQPAIDNGRVSTHGTGLSIRGLCFAYARGDDVVCDLSIDVPARGVHAVLGPSGCGKTTLLRLIAGLERPRAGTIEVGGECVAGEGVFVAAARRRVAVVFQDYALFPTMTALANIRLALRHHPRGERTERARALLDVVGMGGFAGAMPHTLSGGQQQRVALARSLAREPTVMLLDEPFASLDPGLRRALRERTLATLRERDIATLLITHDEAEAALADARTVMADGAAPC